MDEDKKKILEYIAKTGDCDELQISACDVCPLGKLKPRPNGQGWLSCVEAVSGTISIDINDKYKKIASEILADMAIQEEIVEGE